MEVDIDVSSSSVAKVAYLKIVDDQVYLAALVTWAAFAVCRCDMSDCGHQRPWVADCSTWWGWCVGQLRPSR